MVQPLFVLHVRPHNLLSGSPSLSLLLSRPPFTNKRSGAGALQLRVREHLQPFVPRLELREFLFFGRAGGLIFLLAASRLSHLRQPVGVLFLPNPHEWRSCSCPVEHCSGSKTSPRLPTTGEKGGGGGGVGGGGLVLLLAA